MSPPSALRFHLVGAVLLLLALAGWWLVALVLSAVTSACPPDPGNPGVLHTGVALAGLPAVLGCAWWAYRARRLGRCWQAWAALALVCAAVLVDAAVTVRVAGCLFTF